MLIPTEHNADEWMEVMETLAIFNPGDLPGYGPRAWCRLEWFIFTLWAAIQGEQRVQLCAVNVEGELIDYPEVNLGDEDELPERGALSVEADRRTFTKVLYTVTLYGKYTWALIFENVWQYGDPRHAEPDACGVRRRRYCKPEAV